MDLDLVVLVAVCAVNTRALSTHQNLPQAMEELKSLEVYDLEHSGFLSYFSPCLKHSVNHCSCIGKSVSWHCLHAWSPTYFWWGLPLAVIQSVTCWPSYSLNFTQSISLGWYRLWSKLKKLQYMVVTFLITSYKKMLQQLSLGASEIRRVEAGHRQYTLQRGM